MVLMPHCRTLVLMMLWMMLCTTTMGTMGTCRQGFGVQSSRRMAPFPTAFVVQSLTLGPIKAGCIGWRKKQRPACCVAQVFAAAESGYGGGDDDEAWTEDGDGYFEGEDIGSRPAVSQIGRKTIGVDYGLRRTGCCVSVGYAPRPLPLIMHKNEPLFVAQEIARHAKREIATQIVVGMPLNSRGEEGEQANSTRIMVNALKEVAPACTIYLWDERFSSAIAREKLQEAGYNSRDMKGMVDVMASIGILQDFYAKGGEGAEVVHEALVVNNSAEELGGDGSTGGSVSDAPQLSFKEWRQQQQQQALADAQNLSKSKGGKKKKKKR